MQILNAAQIRDWDAATLRAQGITSLQLMERAAAACATWLMQRYTRNTAFVLLCGTGNNGGDGLAVARLLHGEDYGISALLMGDESACSSDAAANLARLHAIDPALVQVAGYDARITSLGRETVLIDALLGTGLNRAVSGGLKAFIEDINRLPNPKISIDLPSGMAADDLAENTTCIKAAQTLTLGCYKRTLLHPETGAHSGEVTLLDIGLDEHFAPAQNSHWHTLDDLMARSLYRPREAYSHKGTYGTAFVIGGSYGLVGAALLMAGAAGRAGAGKVRALIPACGYTALQAAAPEAMCFTSGEKEIEQVEGWESAQGIGIGPGMLGEKAAAAFAAFLKKADRPLVLDAEAINILGAQKGLWPDIPAGSILTPHPKEFERLAGATKNSFERTEAARAWALQHKATLVLKDRHTIILTPSGHGFYNLNGNAGLATGGSGDVLTGIITGLLAQGYAPMAAAMLGVWLHGKAGEIAATQIGAQEAVLAGDIVAAIGQAYAAL